MNKFTFLQKIGWSGRISLILTIVSIPVTLCSIFWSYAGIIATVLIACSLIPTILKAYEDYEDEPPYDERRVLSRKEQKKLRAHMGPK